MPDEASVIVQEIAEPLRYLPGIVCNNPAYDNGPVLNKAIAGTQVRGGTLRLPPCDIYYQTPLNLLQCRDIIFSAEGGLTAGSPSATRLIFNGPHPGILKSAVDARSSTGIVFRDLQLTHTTSLEGAYLVDFAHSINSDSAFSSFERCYVGGFINLPDCFTLVNLDQAICCGAHRTNFQSALTGLRGASSIVPGSMYSNGHLFSECVFQNFSFAPVVDPGEAWTFLSPTVEQLSNGGAGFLRQNIGHTAKAFTVLGGWFGDANLTGTWFEFSGTGFTVIGAQLGGGQFLCRFGNVGITEGVTIMGNHVEGTERLAVVSGNEFAAGHSRWEIFGNSYLATAPMLWGAGSTMPPKSIIDMPKDKMYQLGMLDIKEGGYSDAVYPVTPPDGTYGYDTLNKKLYIRGAGVWKSVQLV